MNERIQALADKIWAEEYWANPNTDRLLPAQLNKFAELIVRECQSRVEQYIKDCGEIGCLPDTVIKEHFGVNEHG